MPTNITVTNGDITITRGDVTIIVPADGCTPDEGAEVLVVDQVQDLQPEPSKIPEHNPHPGALKRSDLREGLCVQVYNRFGPYKGRVKIMSSEPFQLSTGHWMVQVRTTGVRAYRVEEYWGLSEMGIDPLPAGGWSDRYTLVDP